MMQNSRLDFLFSEKMILTTYNLVLTLTEKVVSQNSCTEGTSFLHLASLQKTSKSTESYMFGSPVSSQWPKMGKRMKEEEEGGKTHILARSPCQRSMKEMYGGKMQSSSISLETLEHKQHVVTFSEMHAGRKCQRSILERMVQVVLRCNLRIRPVWQRNLKLRTTAASVEIAFAQRMLSGPKCSMSILGSCARSTLMSCRTGDGNSNWQQSKQMN
mmetsp:Transcript_66455/g.107848  ORF Transcript_66455/g.107848 Transcript_66455/m.107848 type:complete len:215 (+) Transcript_66455:217-861(+)